MNNIIDWDDLITPNKDVQVTVASIFGNEVLILDNVLTEESFSNLSEVSKNLTISRYKSCDSSQGFIDARFSGVQELKQITSIVLNCVRNYWSDEVSPNRDFGWAINYFKSLSTDLPFIGGTPHIDNGGTGVAALMYLNNCKVEGTALYKTSTGVSRVLHTRQIAPYDYSQDYRLTAKNFRDNFVAREVIPGEPNRMIIYNEGLYHAASHTEKQHTNEYRRTLVSFYDPLFSHSDAK